MTDSDNREEALSIYSGPRRTYEIFCIVAESPQSMQQILDAVPGDEEFIRSIVRGMVEDDLINPTAEGDTYELSSHGQQIKETLDQVPEQEKVQAYQEAWGSPPPDGY
jgi:predicted transcriptional regulator